MEREIAVIDTEFMLAERLHGDTFHVTDLALSRVLLMNDTRFPWIILVPRINGVSELFDLNAEQRALLIEESAYIAQCLKAFTGCDKINVATLGNSVSQLHMHVVARFKGDAAWPNPVWGVGNSQKLTDTARDEFCSKLLEMMENISLK